MKPIKFKGFNVTYAEGQDEYNSLPAHKDERGLVTTCWKLSLVERIKILFTGRMWWSQLTFNQSLQPVVPNVHYPFVPEETEEGGE